jgi:hypothetical protein
LKIAGAKFYSSYSFGVKFRRAFLALMVKYRSLNKQNPRSKYFPPKKIILGEL